MKQLGILGGMGAAAGVDLYSKIISLTPANYDQEHIPVVLDSYTQIPDRTKFILTGGENPLNVMIERVKILQSAGCQAIAIACNTAHYFADEIQKQTGVEILHIAKITVEHLKKNYPDAKNIAVISTTGTQKARIYDEILEKNQLNTVFIDENLQKDIMDVIYLGAKCGKIREFVPKFNSVLSSINADIFIAACTEIPLFLPYLDDKFRFVDATLELAKACVKFGLGK